MGMDYAAARIKINTGDVLAIRGRTAFAHLTALVQRLGGLGDLSSVSHMGIAWWVEGRLYSVEMDGRHNVLRPLSQHIAEGCGVDVYRCPVPEAMAAQFDRATASPIQYSFADLIRIGARLIFGGKTGSDGDGAMVCSTFAARWLQWAQWVPPPGLAAMPSPGELCQALGTPSLTVQAAIERPFSFLEH
jgi:hypothetical protein